MKTTHLWMVLPLVGAGAALQSPLERALTAADVERMSGLKGVFTVSKNAKVAAVGDLNFAHGPDTSLVISVLLHPQVQDAAGFARSFTQLLGKDAVHIVGLGDDALWVAGWHAVLVRKGRRTVQLTSGTDARGDWSLTEAQLRELARIMASRL